MSKKVDFKEKLNELEQIVAKFEAGDIDLDTALDDFEQGMKLAEELKEYLDTAQNRVEEVKKKFDDTLEPKEE